MLKRPAAKMYYSAAGRSILIEAFDEWSKSAVSYVLGGWYLAPTHEQLAETPDVTLRIRCGVLAPEVPTGLTTFEIVNEGRCHTDQQTFYLKFAESLIVFGPGNSPVVDLWIDRPYELATGNVAQLLSQALSPALRRCSLFEIHSAAVVGPSQKKAILLAGPSGSGKSTLTAQLALSGWDYLSDDILLLQLRNNQLTVQAFRKFFALTAATLAAVQLPVPATSAVHKERVIPQDHFKTTPIQQAEPGCIIFPTVIREARSRLAALGPTEAMTKLLRLCPWASYDKPTSVAHLQVLGYLANSTTAFELLAGRDILDQPNRVAELLGEVSVKSF